MDQKGTKKGNPKADCLKKRTFRGSQYTPEADINRTSTLAEKIFKKGSDFEVNVDTSLCQCIINFALFLTLKQIVICKTCKKDIQFLKRAEIGLRSLLAVQCECEDVTCIPSSPKVYNSYEINRKIAFAMRMLDPGLQGINTFLVSLKKIITK